MEVWHVSDNDFKNLLDEIIGIMGLEVVPLQPSLEHGTVQRIEALPGFGVIRLLPQSVEEALSSLHHGHPSFRNRAAAGAAATESDTSTPSKRDGKIPSSATPLRKGKREHGL